MQTGRTFTIYNGPSLEVNHQCQKYSEFNFRDLEVEIEKFEKVCAELNRISDEDHSNRTQAMKKIPPKIPPKPKFPKFQLEEPNTEGTEV